MGTSLPYLYIIIRYIICLELITILSCQCALLLLCSCSPPYTILYTITLKCITTLLLLCYYFVVALLLLIKVIRSVYVGDGLQHLATL